MPDDSEMTRYLLQSVAILCFPIDEKELIPINKIKWRWLHTCKSFTIWLWHVWKHALISQAIVAGLGSSILGRPAVSNLHSSRSFIILTGWLFSVIHLTRCTLKNNQLMCQRSRNMLYQTLTLVWDWLEESIGCWPWDANKQKMEPLVPSTSAPFVPLCTASSPKHQITWCRRFAVEALSLESWKWRTPPTIVLHFWVAQGKMWHSQPL